MGLLEKLKNTFFEEEEYLVDEPEEEISKKVETKEVKKEVVKKEPVKEEKIEEEEELLEDEDFDVPGEEDFEFSDSNLVNKNNKLSYFNDDDFVDTSYDLPNVSKKETKKVYGGSEEQIFESINISHNDTKNYGYGENVKEKFKPTPIISPIYGILDKNYDKDQIIDKKDRPSSYVSTKNADLDSIRRKAYGNMYQEEEKEEEEFPNFDSEEQDPLLYDMMVDDTKPVVDQVTMADAEEYFNDLGLEYNVDYKDATYQTATGRRTKNREESENKMVINDNNNYDEDTKDNVEDSDDDAALEDNLFDLVNTIYEDGE